MSLTQPLREMSKVSEQWSKNLIVEKFKLNLVFAKDKIHLKILNVRSQGHAHYLI